jgi:hypothetical protein
MKFFTLNWYEKMRRSGFFPIVESDEEWEHFIRISEEEGNDWRKELMEQLREEQAELLRTLPERFHRYILDGTFNQPELPRKIREDYLHWVREKKEEVEATVEQYSAYLAGIRGQLPEGLLSILEAGLHDAQINGLHRSGDQIRIILDSGFQTGHRLVIEIDDILSENSRVPLEPGMYWLYEEAHPQGNAFTLGVLFDSPLTEWEITARDFQIRQFYRKDEGVRWVEEGRQKGAGENDIREAEGSLNTRLPGAYADLMRRQNGGKIDHPYFLTKERTVRIIEFYQIQDLRKEQEMIIFARAEGGTIAFQSGKGDIRYLGDRGENIPLADSFMQFLHALYSDEVPHAEDSDFIPLPDEEIEKALSSDSPEMVVHALNTLILDPDKHGILLEKWIPLLVDHKNEAISEAAKLFVSYFLDPNLLSPALAGFLQKRGLLESHE